MLFVYFVRMFNFWVRCVIVLYVFITKVCYSEPLHRSNFELSIIHFSDFHSRFIPVSPTGGLCYDYAKEKCVGGVARVATIVNQLKKVRPNAIFLNAGDCFQGTLYFAVHRGNITAYFMNKLPHDAITIGNHDFDDEIPGLVSYINQLNAPVVVSNIDYSDEPSIPKNFFTNSTIIQKGGKNIGVIGLITSDTKIISTHTGNLKFLDEVATVNLEAKKLKENGVNIIIVLSHCGIEHDKIIASSCPDVDVIVGGHSHILLYNGVPPSNELAYGEYPLVVTQEKGNRKVLIVHASAFTKYMGDIRVVFDQNDEVTHWAGNPIYLDKSIIQDPLIVKDLQPWKVEVDKIGKRLIGKSLVFLNGSCATSECNLGNLITDALVDKYACEASIGLQSAVNIQNSIPAGQIVYEDVYMTLPYNNTWDLVQLQGKDLLQLLEENVAASASNTTFLNYRLLQWSGLKVVYDLNSKGSKVVSVKVRCLQCVHKKYEELNLTEWYSISLPSYLVSSAFPIILNKHRKHVIGKTSDVENLIKYIKKVKEISIKTEGRIVFI